MVLCYIIGGGNMGTKKLFFSVAGQTGVCVCVCVRLSSCIIYESLIFFAFFFNPSKRERVEFNWIKNIKTRSLSILYHAYTHLYTRCARSRVEPLFFSYLPAAYTRARAHTWPLNWWNYLSAVFYYLIIKEWSACALTGIPIFPTNNM
jgi:hypothetical protein